MPGQSGQLGTGLDTGIHELGKFGHTALLGTPPVKVDIELSELTEIKAAEGHSLRFYA
jgi:hypothetical protein